MDTSKSLELRSTADKQKEVDRMATGLLSLTKWVSRTGTYVRAIWRRVVNISPFQSTTNQSLEKRGKLNLKSNFNLDVHAS